MIPDDIIARVRSIPLPEVVSRLVPLKGSGHTLKGLCPFHSERTPSFHVHPDFYKCFGCGKAGDVISFVRETESLSFSSAVAALCHRFNIPFDGDTPAPTLLPRPKPRIIPTRAPSETWLRIQAQMRAPTFSEASRLSSLRAISLAAVELAAREGQLFIADLLDDGFDVSCWIITDSTRRNAQARRLDGKPFASIGGKKAKTIPGCEASWPIGITSTKPDISLVEGGPDLLSMWHFAWLADRHQSVAPVAMLGASNTIHPDAIPHFSGRHVRIYPHADANAAGENAALRWASQLQGVAAHVTMVPIRTFARKDVNELTEILREDEE